MTDTFATQCPHCRTRFRVNRAQLDAARGAVRCGSCLRVFNAAEHLIERPAHPTDAEAPISAAPAAAPPVAPPAEIRSAEPPAHRDYDELDLGDLDLDTLDLDEELARLESQERQLTATPQSTDVPAPDPAAPRTRPAPVEPQLPPTGSLLVIPSGQGERPEPPLTLEPHVARDEPRRSASRETPAVRGETRQPVLAGRPAHGTPEPPGEGLLELVDEPLRLDWRKPRQPWGRRLVWIALNLLAIAILAGQYLWFHYDELARQDSYRPWFERLCPYLGCSLPPRVDIARIRSSNLVVRNHPEFAGALVVDAILYNRAAFAQPFPLLELRFADINGQTVATRRFKPNEYLGGELAGQQEMPPQTPIHISLEILDPGTQALNYSLSFHSPE
ncbi:hypothetical protein AvCA_06930 [Azotobacter vinelandii CA]|uniref:Zinc finger/thioredoxin putative domain-containing protein n=2 Tax=Azotobacter vinelandii TaxID=354 RepID=C1DLJ5_AZOVD|nr:DUF3426 domain-containing protein [Azotobacter vinelandii]ACO76943.1 conserved hypothetical protein [Azotobacter vinelandii DJ]AGK17218.1 hypothetical protein AvCA_06930 [Azotobacter vinelandii CA]AGK19453.1 hypothetical protein AvCA6_06930 [Azotobacter vinelandii CA6]SFX40751.1 MJ0042 family finger-like domain-containing protein [Azotobacter vinelandii]GLK59097.1 hypothetical protein GCM10017624_12540 [Azotobacter vinelandii]